MLGLLLVLGFFMGASSLAFAFRAVLVGMYLHADNWSFYIFSSGSRLNELGRADFEGKGIEDWSLLCHLFAQ
jgi:hypothetical protein